MTRSCQIAIALRPCSNPASMSSRYGSHALADGLRSATSRSSSTASEPVITSMAGFESPPTESAGSEPVITSMAGFAVR